MDRSTTPAQNFPPGPNEKWPPEAADLLARVDRLQMAGSPQDALVALNGSAVVSPWVENARGVCLLRLGRARQAVDVLRGLVFDTTRMGFRPDADPVFEANYATSLLLAGNADSFEGILGGIRDRRHPAVVKLADAVRRWRASFTWGEWLRACFGGAARPLVLDFPPGDL
jgi:hypothetical protein